MNLTGFLHGDNEQPTTLAEMKRVYDSVVPNDFLGLYAYATQSGVSAFDLAFGGDFWSTTPSRWLFGIDYGRTQPQAIRSICEKPNTEVRIHDGDWIVGMNGFIPRRDFHAKSSFLLNEKEASAGVVIGSGNFSSNGLRKSIEAGVSVEFSDPSEVAETIGQAIKSANALWESATPVDTILAAYEASWSNSFFRNVENAPDDAEEDLEGVEMFWIEAGYITKNRGPDRPGNQIDFPRGMCRYFGFSPPADLERNSVIGTVTFSPPSGENVSQNLRLGNNLMEKISLPIPETHGFDIYDGKILVFQRENDAFVMRALEADDFESAFGDRLAGVRVMNSGRRYGCIVE